MNVLSVRDQRDQDARDDRGGTGVGGAFQTAGIIGVHHAVDKRLTESALFVTLHW